MLLLVAAVCAACLLFAPSAGALPYVAREGKVLVGVAGGRTATGYERAAGKRPAMFQFFVAWDDRFRYAYRRAEDADAALMLHLSTNNGPGTQERTTPRAIGLGREDAYLYSLGRDLDRHGRPVYLRLFSEMNNAANPYCVYQQSSATRDEAHSHYWFRQAWRRVFLILNGGRVAPIQRHLRRLGLPALKHLRRRARRLPRPRVALQWVPMTAGSPDIPRNRPSAYWPGARYVDWVGTDFYSRFPNFAGLDRFYGAHLYAGKPFVFGEWAMWGDDDPAFMRRFFAWVATHPRVRMLAYNQGNTPKAVFRLYRYPKASRAMRRALRANRYTSRVPQPKRSAVRTVNVHSAPASTPRPFHLRD